MKNPQQKSTKPLKATAAKKFMMTLKNSPKLRTRNSSATSTRIVRLSMMNLKICAFNSMNLLMLIVIYREKTML